MNASERGIRSAQLGILVNTLLAITKLAAGLVGNAYALAADAVESTADIFSSTIVWGELRLASREPDDAYPFGSGKAEALAAVVVSLMLLAAAVGIAIEAIAEIRTPHSTPAPWTLAVLVGVMAIKWLVSRRVRAVGRDREHGGHGRRLAPPERRRHVRRGVRRDLCRAVGRPRMGVC